MPSPYDRVGNRFTPDDGSALGGDERTCEYLAAARNNSQSWPHWRGGPRAFAPARLSTTNRARLLQGLGAENLETVSEDTARAIDREVKQLMTETHDRAVQILQEHRTVLDAVVRLLLEKEVVEGTRCGGSSKPNGRRRYARRRERVIT